MLDRKIVITKRGVKRSILFGLFDVIERSEQAKGKYEIAVDGEYAKAQW